MSEHEISDDNDKIAKQKAFLQPWIDRANASLDDGVKSLKYWRHPQADWLHAELEKHRAVLVAMTAPKDTIKNAVAEIDGLADYGCCMFSDVLSGAFTVTSVNEEFEPAGPSDTQKQYQDKIAKAFDHKQQKAAGFDGQGGGVARTAQT